MCVSSKDLSLKNLQGIILHWLEKEGLEKFISEFSTIFLLLLSF